MNKQHIAGLVAVAASLALGISAVGVVATATAATPPVVHPLHQGLVAVVVAAPIQEVAADPADTYEADPPDALSIEFSSSNTAVACNTQAPTTSYQYISFSWNVTGAERVFFGVDTTDAQAEPMFVDLPHSGNSHTEFPAGYEDYTYACPEPSHQYTITAVDDQGHAISRTVTVVNNGDTVS